LRSRTVGLIDIKTGTETIIAMGGTRGDFVSLDTSNGTLFLSQTERIDRLSCGTGCSIGGGGGGGGTGVPEPATLTLLGLGLAALGLRGRRRT
jgi:PEP-CTERM motif-containing protein